MLSQIAGRQAGKTGVSAERTRRGGGSGGWKEAAKPNKAGKLQTFGGQSGPGFAWEQHVPFFFYQCLNIPSIKFTTGNFWNCLQVLKKKNKVYIGTFLGAFCKGLLFGLLSPARSQDVCALQNYFVRMPCAPSPLKYAFGLWVVWLWGWMSGWASMGVSCTAKFRNRFQHITPFWLRNVGLLSESKGKQKVLGLTFKNSSLATS